MATIKSYTSLVQSKKLAEILPIESADMHYFSGDECDICFGNGVYEEIAIWFSDGTPKPADIPCWSLAALLEVLHENKICHYNNRYYCQYMSEGDEFPIYSTAEYDNPVDACYEIIIKLHELNLL